MQFIQRAPRFGLRLDARTLGTIFGLRAFPRR